LDAHGLYSIRSYKLLELGTTSPGHANGHVNLYARGTWRDAPQVSFYGIGPNSVHDDRVKLGIRETVVTAGATARSARWLVVGGAVGYEDYSTEFPGPGPETTYLHTTGSAGFDSRPAAGYARHGGFYNLTYHNYNDRGDAFSFDRVDAELVQHIPILRDNWVISLRGRMQTTLDDDDVVPYYMMPSLGSGSTLRGYGSWRFRDRHSELFSVEWRWIPNRLGLDMALFYDAGKVVSDRSEFSFSGLKSDFGVGARFHGPALTAFRVEWARGNEGMRVVFSGGPAF
jgi:hypothetical protein